MGKIFIECERQIYSKMMRIRRAKIKKDEGAKEYVKLKSPKMNIYRQYFCLIFH